jgi:hypothetical protein
MVTALREEVLHLNALNAPGSRREYLSAVAGASAAADVA